MDYFFPEIGVKLTEQDLREIAPPNSYDYAAAIGEEELDDENPGTMDSQLPALEEETHEAVYF